MHSELAHMRRRPKKRHRKKKTRNAQEHALVAIACRRLYRLPLLCNVPCFQTCYLFFSLYKRNWRHNREDPVDSSEIACLPRPSYSCLTLFFSLRIHQAASFRLQFAARSICRLDRSDAICSFSCLFAFISVFCVCVPHDGCEFLGSFFLSIFLWLYHRLCRHWFPFVGHR